MGGKFNRRTLFKGTAATAVVSLAAFEIIAVAAREVANLKPGQFLWMPEKSPSGPVAIIVSLPEQLVHVYRGGVQIGLSTCSTGKKGHSTPTGVFTILEKDKHHHSSTYDNAPMPNMNRLTWSGVALHAGNLPGYPASHGCVRLPIEFSELLFTVTHVGTPVIIADDHSEPAPVTHPGPILSSLAAQELQTTVASLQKKPLPPQERHKDMQHAVSILVSRADQELYVLKDGNIVAKGSVEIVRPNEPLGSHVFILVDAHKDGRSANWHAIRHGSEPSASAEDLIGRVQSDPSLAKQVAGLMHPGLVLVVTDQPLHRSTRSKRDFVVIAQDSAWQTDVQR
jgi:L,D-transpeptidase catalytic domain